MSSLVNFGLNLLRTAVSGRRNRFQDPSTGDDLDLTYITPRIIAMAFPASDLESLYRNNISDVARCLDRRHKDAYLIVNLSERNYDNSFFDHRVLPLGFPDHYAPPVEVAWTLCITMDGWLRASPSHVAVVHCLAGKGRTGAVIACYLLFSGYFFAMEEAATNRLLVNSGHVHRDGGGGGGGEGVSSAATVVSAVDSGANPFAASLESEKISRGNTKNETTKSQHQTATSFDSSRLIALAPPHELARLALAHFRGRRGEGVKYPSQERTVRYFAHVVHSAIVAEHNRLVKSSFASISSVGVVSSNGGRRGENEEEEEEEEERVPHITESEGSSGFIGANPLHSSSSGTKDGIRWVRKEAAEIIRSVKNLPLLNRTIVKVVGVRIVGIPRVAPSASSDGVPDFAPTVLITSAPFQGRTTKVIYSSSWHSPVTRTYSADDKASAVFNFNADLEGDVLLVLRHGVSVSDDSGLGALVFGGGGAGVVGSGKEVLRFSFHSAFIARESVSPGVFRLVEKDVDMEKKSKAAFSLPPGFHIDLLYEDIVESNSSEVGNLMKSNETGSSPLSRDDDIVCSGFLRKRGSLVRTWKKRWFVLRRNLVSVSEGQLQRASSPVDSDGGDGETDSIIEEGDEKGEEQEVEAEEEESIMEKTRGKSPCASLNYFVEPSDTLPRGVITVSKSTGLSARLLGKSSYDLERSGGKDNCFSIRHKGHGYYFIADCREDAMMWINAFKDL